MVGQKYTEVQLRLWMIFPLVPNCNFLFLFLLLKYVSSLVWCCCCICVPFLSLVSLVIFDFFCRSFLFLSFLCYLLYCIAILLLVAIIPRWPFSQTKTEKEIAFLPYFSLLFLFPKLLYHFFVDKIYYLLIFWSIFPFFMRNIQFLAEYI